jgi:hypothetical protein
MGDLDAQGGRATYIFERVLDQFIFSHLDLFGVSCFWCFMHFTHLDRDQFLAWMPEAVWYNIKTNIFADVEARDMQ